MDTTAVIAFTIPGEPVAKGRARSTPLMRNGRPVIGKGGRPIVTQYTPDRTARYENLVRLAAQQAMAGQQPTEVAISLTVRAFLPIPQSWSLKKQRAAALGEIMPAKKPDLDNLLKAIKDGANGVTWRDDAQVVDVCGSKRYGTPRVEVEIRRAA